MNDAAQTVSPDERIRFVDVSLHTDGDTGVSGRVALSLGPDRIFSGVAEGSPADEEGIACVAQATANALEQYARGRFRLNVRQVYHDNELGSVVVVLTATSMVGGGEQPLVGSAFTEGAPLRAAGLAVLSATNRYVRGWSATETAFPTSRLPVA